VPFLAGLVNLVTTLARPLPMSGVALSVVLLLVLGQAVADYVGELIPATLVVDGVSRRVRTRCPTVGDVLKDIGIVVRDGDLVNPDIEAPMTPEMTITVRHARPITVVADGATRTVYAHSGSAGQILSEVGVELRPGDELRVDGERTNDGQVAPMSRIEVERAAVVYLTDGDDGRGGGVVHTLHTAARTLEQTLAEAQVLLHLGDQVYPDLDTPVFTGLRVRIRRGVPVQVLVDGRTLRTRTQRATVGEALAELGVSLLGKDYSEPAAESAIQNNQRIQVVRVAEETIVEQTEVPYETVWVPDVELELDHRRLDDAGDTGIARRRYKAVYHDGKEVDRYLEAEWMAQEPRARQVAYGTRIVVRTTDTPYGPIEYWRRIRVFRTAYTAATCGKEPDHPLYGITRLGWKMRHGIIAVDPRVIRLRSKLYVPDYGPGIAGDTGGFIKGRHIDLGYEEDGLVWHYEWGYVYVLTPVPPASQIPWILPDYPRER
jgi:uncharacterized protein YabE (DUF348 family)